jgi:hypothetical protein
MYCCICGANLAGKSTSCRSCGAPVPPESPSQSGSSLALEEGAIRDILSEDRQSTGCHKCGSKATQHTWQFGLGKVIASRHAWGQTAISAAVSAVTLPLLGAGVLKLPGKETSFHVLRLRLNLCDSCARSKGTAYSMHPAWKKATSLRASSSAEKECRKAPIPFRDGTFFENPI